MSKTLRPKVDEDHRPREDGSRTESCLRPPPTPNSISVGEQVVVPGECNHGDPRFLGSGSFDVRLNNLFSFCH